MISFVVVDNKRSKTNVFLMHNFFFFLPIRFCSRFATPIRFASLRFVRAQLSVHMGYCGAALIGPDLVLTAAHCGDPTNEQLQIGAYRRQRADGGALSRFCDRWIPHPLWDDENISNGYDFALCLLDEPVDDDVPYLELNRDPYVPYGGETLVVQRRR